MDEILELLRVAWRDDPVSFDGDGYELTDIRFLPKPAARDPDLDRRRRRGVIPAGGPSTATGSTSSA